MNIKDLVVVTGIPGIQRIAASRDNGMMVEDLDTGKVRFASVRKHQFSPLESISIYTDDNDAVELKAVLQAMFDNLEETPPVAPNAKPEELRTYLSKILPNYDRDQVHISDIKKLIRWFHFLNERGFLTAAADEEE
jgi:type II secretory pathway predicted ATPase ExeA